MGRGELGGEEKLLGGFTQKYPLGLDSSQIIVRANDGAKVLGKITLPYSDPADPARFVSTYSNPPGVLTDHSAIILNQFGKGQVIYVSGELENGETYRHVFINLIRQLFDHFTFEGDAPQSVEITAFSSGGETTLPHQLNQLPKRSAQHPGG